MEAEAHVGEREMEQPKREYVTRAMLGDDTNEVNTDPWEVQRTAVAQRAESRIESCRLRLRASFRDTCMLGAQNIFVYVSHDLARGYNRKYGSFITSSPFGSPVCCVAMAVGGENSEGS